MKITNLVLTFLVITLLVVTLAPALAHGDEETNSETPTETSEGIDWTKPIPYVMISGIILVIFTLIALTIRNRIDGYKKLIFIIMVVPVILASLYLAGHTIYENVTSETKGPVHWHADYQVIICGEHFGLIDPEGIKNKIGSSTFHEHNDDRIHFEGTPKKIEDISLGNYFKTIGGELERAHLIFPTNNGVQDYKDGDECPERTLGTLKVYVNGEKIEDPESYVIYPNSLVPPGDCIIVLFDSSNSDTTDIICPSWEVQGWTYENFQRREVTIGDKTWQ